MEPATRQGLKRAILVRAQPLPFLPDRHANAAVAVSYVANRVAFEIAGLSFRTQSEPALQMTLNPELRIFAADPGVKEQWDVEISAAWADTIRLAGGTPAFNSGGLWTAFHEVDGTSLYFQNDYLGKEPYKHCFFNKDVTRARVTLSAKHFNREAPLYPLEYPLDELLMINRLGCGDGAEIHSCGVVTGDGLGRLFVGHSGAGKSTASRLWMKRPGVRVLSDDRVILRQGKNGPTMHGTPWHGDAGLAEQASAPVHKIYLLEQASTNEIVPLAPARAAGEIFARTFVPHHAGSAIANTLQFLEVVTKVVPVVILRCTADERAIDEVLRVG